MSAHNARTSLNNIENGSHRNNPNPSIQAQSVHLQQPVHEPPARELVAVYKDGKYHLTDPESLQKLKKIQEQLKQQQSKMLKLQGDSNSLHGSFLSLQEYKDQRQSNRSFCHTEFNQNKQLDREQKVKQELEQEQDKYHEKMKKQKHQVIGIVQGKEKRKKEEKIEGEDNEVVKEEKKQSPQKIERGKSNKASSRKDSKQKSYRKSRIEQSIKDNIELLKEEVPGSTHSPVLKEKSMKSQRQSHAEAQKVSQKAPSQRQMGEKQSEKPSVKQSISKQNVIVIAKEEDKQKEDKQLSPSQQNMAIPAHQLIQAEEKGQADIKSEHKTSKAVSHRLLGNEGSVKKEHSSKYEVKLNAVGSVHSSQIEPPSIKESAQNPRSNDNVDSRSKKSTPANQIIEREAQSNKVNFQAEGSSLEKKQQPEVTKKLTVENQEIKSKKSRTVRQQQTRSKKASMQKEQIKSKQGLFLEIEQTKSRQISNKQQVQSRKSNANSKVAESIKKDQQELKGSKKQLVANVDDNKSRHSSKLEQKVVQKSSRARSIKKSSEADADDKKSKRSEVDNGDSKRNSPTNNNQKSVSGKNIDNSSKLVSSQQQQCKSVSRASEKGDKQAHINEIKFQNMSQKNNSLIQHNQESINQSSHYKLQLLQNELNEEKLQQLQTSKGEFNMKKKKEENINDNQSEKKSRSFIIHSRNGSVKERSEKSHDKLKRSKLSQKKSQKMSEGPSIRTNSVTKEELFKLHQQVAFLQDKLKKVEERQEQMEKLQYSISKIHKQELEEANKPQLVENNQSEPPTPGSPLIQPSQILLGLRSQGKLHLESSIIQVNTRQQALKKLEKDAESLQKQRLKEEIVRLKKIIREMQIEKIKSIDQDSEQISPLLKKDEKNLSRHSSKAQYQKQSINYGEGTVAQKKLWGKSRIDEIGRIIKNSNFQQDKGDISPRRRSQNIKIFGNEDEVVMEPEDLPFQSTKKYPSKLIKGAKHSSMIQQLQDKEKDFHNFIESSRILMEQSQKKQLSDQQSIQRINAIQQFSKISEPGSKINYSRMVEEFKNTNPEEEQPLPEITLRDISIPEIPNTPTPEMQQDELLTLAKRTYQAFGINIDLEDKQLCVKKYKNCVVFSITSNTSECILWHFSGKFYMGGWKAGQPGEGEKHGEGLEVIPEKYIYKGQFLNGKKNGTGILKLVNGNIYDGQWIQGLKNGRGAYIDAATRVVYSGEWRDGKKDGQGYLKLSQKQYYYGTFSKSVKEGFGTQIFVNGDKYKGEYKNGKFHGKGKYIWANGSCYEGQFMEGVRQGQGSWKSAKINGDIYVGTYEADKKNGYGRYVWANGCIYEGGFANDLKHGKGRITYQDGKEVKGIWEEGNLVKTDNQNKQAGVDEEQPLRRSIKINSLGYHPATRSRF